MHPAHRERLFFLMTLAILVVLGLLSGRWYARLDLTEHNIYTISGVTRDLLAELPEGVEITYYVSPELRRISNAPLRIEELLEEYRARGGNRVRLDVTAPRGEELAQELEELGIRGRQLRSIATGEERFTTVYSGIVLRYRDRSRVIPFIMDTAALEYELTSALFQLLEGGRRRIALLSGIEGRSVSQNYRLLQRSLEEHFQVELLQEGSAIPEQIDVLALLGGRDLSAATIERVEAFYDGGGSLLVLADGVAVETEGALDAEAVERTAFDEMLLRSGIRLRRELVLDEYHADFHIPHRSAGGTVWESLGGYPYWPSVREASVSETHPITARFSGLDLLWASPIEVQTGEAVETAQLIHSSTRAWTVAEDFALNPNTSFPSPPPETRRERYLLGVALSGSPSGARMVVFGDTDFASDLLHYSKSGYNIDLLLNTAEWLADDERLLQLRTRRSRQLHLDRLDPAREEAQYRLSRIVNLILVPLAVVLFGLLRLRRRRRLERG